MSTRYFFTCVLCAGILLVTMPTALLAQSGCGLLVNGDFEDPTLGSFNDVVSPQFTVGFWGDESAAIVDSTSACLGVLPYEGTRMLEEWPTGGVVTQTWQVILVDPNPGGTFSASARLNACEGISPRAAISILTFNSATGWPNPTSSYAVGLDLDASSSTWELLTIGCETIPDDTQYILIDVQFNNASLDGKPGFVDDVQLFCGCPVANENLSWGTLKARYLN